MKTKLLLISSSLVCIAVGANAAINYEQAFIGTVGDNGNDVETIDTRIDGSSSGIVDYNHNVNLSSALGVGGGGSAMHAGSFDARVVRSTADVGFNYTLGQDTWYAAVMRVTNTLTNNISLSLISNGTVNDLFFDISGTTASVTYFEDSGTNTVNLFTSVAADTDYLFLAKVTSDAVGGTSAINDVSFWFNPTDLSSEAQLTATALGAHTNTSVKLGRTTETGVDQWQATIDGIGATDYAFLDQIYIAESLSDLAPIPEASTFVLIGFTGLALLRRRRV